MKLYVGNLNFRTTEDDLRGLMDQFGEVTDLIILNDRETGRSRGFGFVTFADDESGRKAIEALHEQDFEGRTLVINEARPREERPAGGGYGGGGNRGGGGGGGRGGYSRGGGGGGGRPSGGGYQRRDDW